LNQKQFLKQGNYLIDEVKHRAEKKGSHFFDKETMRFFSSRTSELCWKNGDNIYFITSEADNGHIKHKGSVRAFTVRMCDKDGDINTIGDFQEHENLNQARQAIKEAVQA
jgi:hypothetical protein